MAKGKELNRYSRLIEAIFFKYFQEGRNEVVFEREEIEKAARDLKIILPKTLAMFFTRFATALRCPKVLLQLLPKDMNGSFDPGDVQNIS